MGKGQQQRKKDAQQQRKQDEYNKKNKQKQHDTPPTSTSDEDDSMAEAEPFFTYNNNPVFPTSSMGDRGNPFKIEMGEKLYNVAETNDGKVLLVSTYTEDLDHYLRQRTDDYSFTFHGEIRAPTDETRELMKGIVRAFCDLIRETPDNELMYLHNPSNYLISGLEQYQVRQENVTFCPPIKILIVKNDKRGGGQRNLKAKATTVSHLLKRVYKEEYYDCDRFEWANFYQHFGDDNDDDRDDRLRQSLDGLEGHHVLWHEEMKRNFIIHLDVLLRDPICRQTCMTIFDKMSYIDDWELGFMLHDPMQDCMDTTVEVVRPGDSGASGDSGAGDGSGAGGGSGAGPSVVAGGGSARGGGQLFNKFEGRRKRGCKFVTELRNCLSHMTAYTIVPNLDPFNRSRVVVRYTHIREGEGNDAFKERSYLPYKIRKMYPFFWNDLVPALREKGFNQF